MNISIITMPLRSNIGGMANLTVHKPAYYPVVGLTAKVVMKAMRRKY